ncbi:oxidoreductase family protein [Plectosphaerella plurivora]|uniref:Oxidoreductase family protein n=1 Tax=Plectosphaerella plurivora TaxID=936078 RepID=A0A9P8VEN9_9PEZI|nr:oxidoreductase family protein [Plectosphaerella plurivora]
MSMDSTTQRIRVAIIGLSSSAKTSWAEQAHLAYLQSPRGLSKYEIVALLNSTTRAAEASRSHFGFSPSVKAYGDPTALASDPDIDLVVCNTRVDVHFGTVAPSLRQGKAIYVEWPLTENLARSVELATLAGESVSAKSVVGLQGQVSPVVEKLRQVLSSGRLGKVLSSDARAFGSLLTRDSLPESLSYFAERKVGGSSATIAYGHMIDYMHSLLGEFDEWHARAQIQRPDVSITSKEGPASKVVSDVPDLITVHGSLRGKSYVAEGATLSVSWRNGTPFKGSPSFDWTINGEKGEIQVLSPSGPYLHSDSYSAPIVVRLHDFASDEVSEVAWDWKDWQHELPIRARNVAEVYERYAETVTGKGSPAWPSLNDGVKRIRELDELLQQFDRQRV